MMFDEEREGWSGQVGMAGVVGLEEGGHGEFETSSAGCVSIRPLWYIEWSWYHFAHLSIHDTFTATSDLGMCKSGGDFGVTMYS